MASSSLQHYETAPYPGRPVSRSRPEWMATIAKLHGMQPADPASARVLELGCATGENLIPMAERAPEATFLGIDYSARQITLAQDTAAGAGLSNITFRQQDILELGEELGAFDYIIAHGVYSWVETPVRDKLLALCRDHLAPRGIAYVSYNTYPGWALHDMFRAMMIYDARGAQDPIEQLSQARTLLEFLHASVTEDHAYDAWLQAELATLLKLENVHLYHDHLEAVNQPVYFRQFMAHARGQALQLLGDGVLGLRATDYLGPESEQNLSLITADPTEKEQFRDIIHNRNIRQTLLCHADVALEAYTSAELKKLYFESRLKPDNPEINIRSSATEHFSTPAGLRVSTALPLIKAAFIHLGEAWPSYVLFEDLVSAACDRLKALIDESIEIPQVEIDRLEENLLQCCAGGVVDVHGQPPAFAARPSEFPVASPLARWQAPRVEMLTSRRHEVLQVSPFDRQVLLFLDGTRDVPKLLDDLVVSVVHSGVTITEAEQPVTDPKRAREILEDAVAETLTRLAYNGFLIK